MWDWEQSHGNIKYCFGFVRKGSSRPCQESPTEAALVNILQHFSDVLHVALKTWFERKWPLK